MQQNHPTTVGYLIGRFNPLQHGHAALLTHAYENNDHLIVLIGSATEARTLKNPLSFDERKALVKALVPEATILPLPDMPSDEDWVSMLQGTLATAVRGLNLSGEVRMRLYSADATRGDDHELRCGWVQQFGHEVMPFKPVTVRADLSASLVRDNWYHGRFDELEQLVPAETYALLRSLDLSWAKADYVTEVPAGTMGPRNSVYVAIVAEPSGSFEKPFLGYGLTVTGELTFLGGHVLEDKEQDTDVNTIEAFADTVVCKFGGFLPESLELVCSHASVNLVDKEVEHQHLFVARTTVAQLSEVFSCTQVRDYLGHDYSAMVQLPISSRAVDVLLSQKWRGAGLDHLKALLYQGIVQR